MICIFFSSCLHFATDKGYDDCIAILLEEGANINDTDDDEMSVLSLTVISEHVDSVVLPRTRKFLLLLTYISRQT